MLQGLKFDIHFLFKIWKIQSFVDSRDFYPFQTIVFISKFILLITLFLLSLHVVAKIASTERAMAAEVNYVVGLNGKAIELSERSQTTEIDVYKIILDDLNIFALNLDKYVKRHSGGAVLDFHTDDGRTNSPLETKFTRMKQKVRTYIRTAEINPF